MAGCVGLFGGVLIMLLLLIMRRQSTEKTELAAEIDEEDDHVRVTSSLVSGLKSKEFGSRCIYSSSEFGSQIIQTWGLV